jgi:hypothetical protein
MKVAYQGAGIGSTGIGSGPAGSGSGGGGHVRRTVEVDEDLDVPDFLKG